MPPLERRPCDLGLLAFALSIAQPSEHPARETERAVDIVVESRDQLLEPEIVLRQPVGLDLQRLREPRKLLIRGQVSLPHDGGRRDREVDRPEERLVKILLRGRQLAGRSRSEPDEVHVPQLFDAGSHHVSPEGR